MRLTRRRGASLRSSSPSGECARRACPNRELVDGGGGGERLNARAAQPPGAVGNGVLSVRMVARGGPSASRIRQAAGSAGAVDDDDVLVLPAAGLLSTWRCSTPHFSQSPN